MTPETRLEIQRLLSALCDGELTAAEHARLEELLRDAEGRRLYLEYTDMHARLVTHPHLPAGELPPPASDGETAASSLPSQAPTPIPFADAVREFRPTAGRFRQGLRYALVAAGTLAASLLVQVYLFPPRGADAGRPRAAVDAPAELPRYVATLAQAVDCVWETGAEALRSGTRLLPGELALKQGVARLHFDSGSDLVIEGPAVLRVESATAAKVLRGKVVFQGDETAAPFDLHTPSATLVDYGTEYAVAVGPAGEEVHVFEGEVRRTPDARAGQPRAEQLQAGQARRYTAAPGDAGQPVPNDPDGFKHQVEDPGAPPRDPAAGLLAYEGFDYRDPRALQNGTADGGRGWLTPWKGFARPADPGDRARSALNVKEGLDRPGAVTPAVGGSLDFTGFTKYYRKLATPVRMGDDGVYYLSFLFRRHGPSTDDPVDTVAVLLRTADEIRNEDPRRRLNIGVGRANRLFTFFDRASAQTPLPLDYGATYLLVAKIVAGAKNPDQVFVRVYGPREPVDRDEPGGWSVVGRPFESDLTFDWLEVHINSKTRQTLDEVRLGSTWWSVTAPWLRDRRDKPANRP